MWDGLGYVIIITVFSILYNFVHFFEYTTEFAECADVYSVKTCTNIWNTTSNSSFEIAKIEYTSLRKDRVYSTGYLITNTAVMGEHGKKEVSERRRVLCENRGKGSERMKLWGV